MCEETRLLIWWLMYMSNFTFHLNAFLLSFLPSPSGPHILSVLLSLLCLYTKRNTASDSHFSGV